MKQFTLALACVIALGLVACSSSSDSTATTKDATPNVATETATEVAATEFAGIELACASCVYHMEGVEGCAAAAKVDGKPMLVTGVEMDAHSLGLCEGPKMANLTGHVEGDNLEVSTFTLE